MKCTSCYAPCADTDRRCPFCGGAVASNDGPFVFVADRRKKIIATFVTVFIAVGTGLAINFKYDLGTAGVIGAVLAVVGYALGSLTARVFLGRA
jgi:hypothetical protein